MEGWMDGWKEGKAGLRIAYSNQKPGPGVKRSTETIPGLGQWDPRKRDSITIDEDAKVNGLIPKVK